MDRRSLPPLGTAGLMFVAFFAAVFEDDRKQDAAAVFYTISLILLGILVVQIVAIWLKDLIVDWLFLRDLKKDQENIRIPPADDEEGGL